MSFLFSLSIISPTSILTLSSLFSKIHFFFFYPSFWRSCLMLCNLFFFFDKWYMQGNLIYLNPFYTCCLHLSDCTQSIIQIPNDVQRQSVVHSSDVICCCHSYIIIVRTLLSLSVCVKHVRLRFVVVPAGLSSLTSSSTRSSSSYPHPLS